MIHTHLRRVIAGEHLTRVEAAEVMRQLMEGTVTPAQQGALLTALHMKGETVEELTGFAEVMRQHAVPVSLGEDEAVDTCGTGGDGGKTFNVSTATAIVAASLSVKVAKHGNRSVSSRSGSSDVLEALGVEVQQTATEAAATLRQLGICFMFAPQFHQSMRHVMSTRQQLGFRTVFNLLGPLTNPAGVKRQLLGVYDRALTEPLARVLQALGSERALVVASEDGLDEISVSATTQVSELCDGQVQTYHLEPAHFGLPQHELTDVAGGDPTVNAASIRAVFAGKKGAARDIVVANTAAVLYLAERANSLREGARLAEQALDDGAAAAKLNEMTAYTGGERHVS